MEFKEIIKSAVDNTQKYVFMDDDGLNRIEFSFILKSSIRYSICVPCQTMCIENCKMCHCTPFIGKLVCRKLSSEEIYEGISYIIKDLNLQESGENLLISFMGMGEPLRNVNGIIDTIFGIYKKFPSTRFAISTSLPKDCTIEFVSMCEHIKKLGVNVKLHLSLHASNEIDRKKLMPRDLNIRPAIALMKFYKEYTGNPVELQYIVSETNSANINRRELADFIKSNDDMLLKFMPLNIKGVETNHKTPKHVRDFMLNLWNNHRLKSEYCISPGLDIGSSCGSFNMEEYDNV